MSQTAEATFRAKLVSVLDETLVTWIGGDFDPADFDPHDFDTGTPFARVYPVTGEQQADRPFISYELDQDLPELTLSGSVVGASVFTFAVNVYSRHYDEAAGIAQQVVEGLQDFRDNDVKACFLDSAAGQSDADGYVYQITWKVTTYDN